MGLAVNRIDPVVLNCRDVDATADWYVRVLGMRREVFGEGRVAVTFGNQKINVRPSGAPNWETGAVDAPGSLDLCFIADLSPDEIGERLGECGVQITAGPVPKTSALGPITSHYSRHPARNHISFPRYSAR